MPPEPDPDEDVAEPADDPIGEPVPETLPSENDDDTAPAAPAETEPA